MSKKTNALRKVIQEKLNTVCQRVYYENADDGAMYPHCVFSFNNIDTGDSNRSDVMLEIDVWDKNAKAAVVEDLCDDIEELFNSENMPQDEILPTFYLVSRNSVRDEDKLIRHRLIRIQVQKYERRGKHVNN